MEEILNTDQAKQRGLGGGPVCFFERDAKPLDCSKVNFDEFWTYLNNIFWCHTLTHSTIFRRLPLNFKDNFKDKLKDNFKDSYKESLINGFGDNFKDNLKDNFKDNFKENFKDIIKNNIKNKINYNIKTTTIQWVVTSS